MDDFFQVPELADCTDEQRERIIALFLRMVQNRVIVRILDASNKQEQQALDNLLQIQDTGAINAFLTEKGLPNMEDMIVEEAVASKSELTHLLTAVHI
ncbi:hypothetical protein HYW94_04340 [Candidatus Uhrbacteria bacterium]|nr:hypothetical protein [Candidatus Uhrbacteria bacterium]